MLTNTQLASGFSALEADDNEFPPSLVKFLRLCRGAGDRVQTYASENMSEKYHLERYGKPLNWDEVVPVPNDYSDEEQAA